jgi:hypothetical protein
VVEWDRRMKRLAELVVGFFSEGLGLKFERGALKEM